MENSIAWYVNNIYQYNELRSLRHIGTSPSIRLLHLWPGSSDDQLAGSLQEYDLEANSCLSYVCLSYRWQGKNDKTYVLVDGKRVEIYDNLWNFLHVLRQPDRELVLWADAICIDQENKLERSNQVALMGNIFSGAQRVRIWLGEHENGSSMLFNWMVSTPVSQSTSLPEEIYHAFLSLARRSYWSRTWVVQECLLARQLLVHCGAAVLSWEIFTNRVKSMMEVVSEDAWHSVQEDDSSPAKHAEDDARRLEPSDSQHSSITTPSSPFYFLDMLIRARSELRAPLGVSPTESRLARVDGPPFLALLHRFSVTQCAEPLDKIYALVPLASVVWDGHRVVNPSRYNARRGKGPPHSLENHQAIAPDYTITFAQAAYRLVTRQSEDVATQRRAWRLMIRMFRSELPLVFPDTEALKDVEPLVEAESDFFDKAFVCAFWCKRKRQFSDEQIRDRIVELYLQHVERECLAADILKDIGLSLGRPAATFTDIASRCFAMLEGTMDVVELANDLQKWLRPGLSDHDCDMLIHDCLPWWKGTSREHFALPASLRPMEMLQPGAAHMSFLELLWGRKPWSDEAWQLAIEAGFGFDVLVEFSSILRGRESEAIRRSALLARSSVHGGHS